MTDDSTAVRAPESATNRPHRAHATGLPGCQDCYGIGVLHVQVKGQLRVERKPCPCTKPGVCRRCLGKGQHDAVKHGSSAGQSTMCNYCQGTGRAAR